MPLFSIQIKNPYTMLIFVSILNLALYFVVAMVYAMKIDNALYYEYPKMSNKEIKRLTIYVLFWIIFFVKLDKIIKGKE
jgi:hypothetical protein